jgi:hypothetical protein
MFVGFLLLIGVAGALLLVVAADRVLKARARGRRLRKMSDRLGAATARIEEEHEQRQARDEASQALTSYIPAIQRPPLELPGVPPRVAARRRGAGERETRREREARRDHDARHAGRRTPHGGAARSASRPEPAVPALPAVPSDHAGQPGQAGGLGSREPGMTRPDS